MRKLLSLLCLSVIITIHLDAQTYPKEGRVLNYRLIGFSFPQVQDFSNCTLEVAIGNQTTKSDFKKNIILSLKAEKNRLIGEVPYFGQEYTWRIRCSNNGNDSISNVFHHFKTGMTRTVDSNYVRVIIFKEAEKYQDAHVFLDGTGVLYDMKGHPVWYLPGKDSIGADGDIKLTPQGTITFMSEKVNKNIYEINYDGDTLWTGPNKGEISGEKVELYNHEFTRLGNGHYMVLGEQRVPWLFIKDTNKKRIAAHSKDGNHLNTPPDQLNPAFGTIIEYDQSGKIVWSWQSSSFFTKCDSNLLKRINTNYHPTAKKEFALDVHQNAFYFDEKEKVVYLSYRGISTVLKVKYPEGTVLNVYGQLAEDFGTETGTEWFCGQHSIKISQDGYMYLFNNNKCNAGAPPTVIMMQQPTTPDGKLKKVWEFNCANDDVIDQKQKEPLEPGYANGLKLNPQIPQVITFDRGGNVVELPDKSIFVDECGKVGKLFIVNRDKQVIWSAFPESFGSEMHIWNAVTNYRASIITDPKDLEKLIFNTEK